MRWRSHLRFQHFSSVIIELVSICFHHISIHITYTALPSTPQRPCLFHLCLCRYPYRCLQRKRWLCTPPTHPFEIKDVIPCSTLGCHSQEWYCLLWPVCKHFCFTILYHTNRLLLVVIEIIDIIGIIDFVKCIWNQSCRSHGSSTTTGHAFLLVLRVIIKL